MGEQTLSLCLETNAMRDLSPQSKLRYVLAFTPAWNKGVINMRVLPSSLLCLFVVTLLAGCFYRSADEVPIIHQGWSARYHYDVDKRRLTSTFGNKQIGRTWGRNERGLVDYDRWMGGGSLVSENLLLARRAIEDAQLEKRWEEAEQAMFDARLKVIEAEAGMDSTKTEDDVASEEAESGEPLPFEPEPFLPDTSKPDGTVPLPPLPGDPEPAPVVPSPFAPLPGNPDPGGGLPPLPGAGGDAVAPTPFPPLPGMQPDPAAPGGGLPPLPGGDPAAPSPFAPLPNP